MNAVRNIIFLLVITQLSACAVMTEKDCLYADWREIGYQVAFSGNTNPEASFERREKACSKHGASADRVLFKQGYSDGAVNYCQLENAVELGVRGQSHAVVNQLCPAAYYPNFYSAFNAGYKLHDLIVRVEESEYVLANAHDSIHQHKDKIAHINKKLSSSDLESSERKNLKRETLRIRKQVSYIKSQLRRHENHLYHQRTAKRRYAEYLYEDYVPKLSKAFIDPRKNKAYHYKK